MRRLRASGGWTLGRRLVPLLIVALTTVGLEVTGNLGWLDNALVEFRMRAAPRAPSGTIAVVDIDARSLAGLGHWPWPRSTYARLIKRLSALGADEIALDIDFSAPSDPAEDAAFEAALAGAKDSVILSSFRQKESATGRVILNAPLPRFAAHAWPAIVNVVLEPDGRVHSLPYGEVVGETAMPSVAALLGRGSGALGREFMVDFSIDADRIERISAIDLLQGEVDPRRIAGKSVIVGASALELRDFFYVPVQGIVSGAVLQTIGAETLRQGRALVRPGSLAALAVAAILLAGLSLLRRRWLTTLAVIGGTAIMIEGAATVLQAMTPLSLTTAPSQAALALLAAVTLVREVNFRAILLLISRTETNNTKAILDRVVADNFAGVVVIDQAGTILAASATAARFLDHGKPLTGRRSTLVLPRELSQAVVAALNASPQHPPAAGLQEAVVADSSGARRILEYVVTPSRLDGAVAIDGRRRDDQTVACLTFRDVTDRRAAEERLAHLARNDALTGWANRNHFAERLERAEGSDNAVVAIGLDRMGEVNEVFGHGVGDRLICAVGQRIAACLRPADLLARLDGNAFVVLLAGAGAAVRADRLAQSLLSRVAEPYELADDRLVAPLSLGIATAESGVSPEAMLKQAEAALHRARAQGGLDAVRFDAGMVAGQAYRQLLQAELWEAFERDEFEVHYQPQADLRDGSLVGAEALVRWRHPRRGLVYPTEFIPVAEAIGLIEALGERVLTTACQAAAHWPPHLKLAVNVSPKQFGNPRFLAMVENALAVAQLPPERLEIEITESVLMDGRGATKAVEGLRALGIGCSIDDFGTGYSSLAYLKRFAVDQVKLDRTFIGGIPKDADAVAIARAVGALAGSLGIRLLAEGIENEDQVAFLRLLGFTEGQGFLYGKAMPDSEFRGFAARGGAAVAEIRRA